MIANIDPLPYLSEFMGLPGIVKGVNPHGYGMLVFSSDLKHMTTVCKSRTAGNMIKFNHGTEEIKERREDCWEFCAQRERIDVIQEQFRQGAQTLPLVIAREGETNCPVCYDPLTGQNMCCTNSHQICLSCFDLLPGVGGQKKCPLCNTQTYDQSSILRYELMRGRIIREDPYFYLDLSSGRNSFYDFGYKEALFVGMMKVMGGSQFFTLFERMLISALYNFYTTHEDRFSYYLFNFLNQVEMNHRTYNPFSDELNPVIKDFLDLVRKSQIYDDVSHTTFFMGCYDDIEFYNDLKDLEGNIERLSNYPGERKSILQREIYFRHLVMHKDDTDLQEIMKGIFKKFAENAKYHDALFRIVVRDRDMT